jgi:hypothetical protein
MAGKVIDASSSMGIGGVAIKVDGLPAVVSASDGTFKVSASDPQQVRLVTLTSPGTIERVTRIRVPGDSPTITLLPKSLDLTSFDQMVRGNDAVLHRWIGAPRLVIQRRALKFTNTSDSAYQATATLLSDADVNELVSNLTEALPQLTGDAFHAFAAQSIETAAEGEMVSVSRPGWIVVARYEGLAAATTFWGYTRWAWNGAGEMQAASMMLDRAHEASAAPDRHALHAHELGHALGDNHVSARDSVMNVSGTVEINAVDREDARLSFLRLPLNRSPDTDPDPVSVNRSKTLRWAEAP